MTTAPHIIVKLSESVANRIAAGEVVERPASVVKELVENAIDAGATRIAVSVREGGLAEIQVTDDGAGVPADQVPLAFERHATSKIRTADDLFAIRTLGFRGEALPSIASVADVIMRTKTREARLGTEIRLSGGRRTYLAPVGTPDGTTVIVSRLFFNTPARRKFLKSEAAERRAIAELVTKLALAHPGIQFVLTAEGREILRTPGDGELLSAAAAVYGNALARTLLPFAREAPFGRVSGLVAPPPAAKGNRQDLSVFVNGRWVDCRALSTAVERAFGTMLPPRRYPVAIVRLDVDPSFVDVNVHPAKTEVRFRDESLAFQAVLHAVREALLGANLIAAAPSAPLAPPRSMPGPPVPELFPRQKQPPSAEAPKIIVWRTGQTGAEATPAPYAASPSGARRDPSPPDAGPDDAYPAYDVDPATGEVREVRGTEPRHWLDPIRDVPVERSLPAGPKDAAEAREWLRRAQVLGQVLDTYMIVPVPWGLWLVDQHVAHERILYEKALRRTERGNSQALLVPLPVDLPVRAVAVLEEERDTLAALGFEYEPFGGTSLLVRSVPAEFAGRLHVVPEILRELAELHADGRQDERRHRIAAMVACKGAVKAGQRLEVDVLKQLLVRLADTENPFACPHGRPIVVEISQAELERRFGRR